jgi:ABC-type Fe3+-hydroxamate transport system substrate-binding protein
MGGLISGIRVLTCAVAFAVLACRQPETRSSSLVVVDDAGDSVAVRVPARRVVSLIPASTELLFAIGAGPAVVGRSAWCDYPPAVSAVPNLGAGIGPNVEAVLAARPDLVVLYNSAQHAAVASRLRGLGVPTIRINTDALADVPRIGKLLGRLTGHRREADSMSAVFDTALATATVDSGSAGRPTVLLLVWEQPPMTVGRGSFLSELVERAGGRNLFADVATSSGPVSIEAVSVRDPELILTTAAGPASFATRPEWQAVRAVREKRFLAVSGSRYDRPGPRSPAAIRALAGRLTELAR